MIAGSNQIPKALGTGGLIILLGVGLAGYHSYLFVTEEVEQLKTNYAAQERKLAGKNRELKKIAVVRTKY